jgi:hypothetical protein
MGEFCSSLFFGRLQKMKFINFSADLGPFRRHRSPIIPIYVGPDAATFYVHHDILTKAAWFQSALCSGFIESEQQSITLREEDPDIFSFIVAWLYEHRYRPIAEVNLDKQQRSKKSKGKSRQSSGFTSSSSSDSEASSGTESKASDGSGYMRRHQRIRRKNAPVVIRQRRSQYVPPPPPPPGFRPPPPHPGAVVNLAPLSPPAGPRPRSPSPSDEELRATAMLRSLDIDVYLCADRFCMEDLKKKVAAHIVTDFEDIGIGAAHPEIFAACQKLYFNLNNEDPLLKKVLTRTGFMLAQLCKNYPEETTRFLGENIDLATILMKETMTRWSALEDNLPAMDPSDEEEW